MADTVSILRYSWLSAVTGVQEPRALPGGVGSPGQEVVEQICNLYLKSNLTLQSQPKLEPTSSPSLSPPENEEIL